MVIVNLRLTRYCSSTHFNTQIT